VAAATAPIKVDVATGGLVSSAAHFMSRSKKDIVDGVARWLCVLLSPDAAVGCPAAKLHIDRVGQGSGAGSCKTVAMKQSDARCAHAFG
jgi:hypothetical protein